MHFEINVALNGVHFFATHERSLTSFTKTVEVYARFLKAFPKSKGFQINVVQYETVGKPVDKMFASVGTAYAKENGL